MADIVNTQGENGLIESFNLIHDQINKLDRSVERSQKNLDSYADSFNKFEGILNSYANSLKNLSNSKIKFDIGTDQLKDVNNTLKKLNKLSESISSLSNTISKFDTAKLLELKTGILDLVGVDASSIIQQAKNLNKLTASINRMQSTLARFGNLSLNGDSLKKELAKIEEISKLIDSLDLKGIAKLGYDLTRLNTATDRIKGLSVDNLKDNLTNLVNTVKDTDYSIDESSLKTINSLVDNLNSVSQAVNRLNKSDTVKSEILLDSLFKQFGKISESVKNINLTDVEEAVGKMLKVARNANKLGSIKLDNVTEEINNLIISIEATSEYLKDVDFSSLSSIQSQISRLKNTSDTIKGLSSDDSYKLLDFFDSLSEASKLIGELDFNGLGQQVDSLNTIVGTVNKIDNGIKRLSSVDTDKLRNKFDDIFRVIGEINSAASNVDTSNIENLFKNSKISADEYKKSIDDVIRSLKDLKDTSKSIKDAHLSRITISDGRKNKKDDSKFTKASKNIKQGTEFFNVITDFGSSLKSGKLSSTAAAASKGLGLMGGALGTAAIAVGGVTAALAVLSKVTLDANRKTISYAQSLRAMGVELSEFDKQNLETSKQMRDLGNRFDNVTQAIGEGLYPVLGGLLDLLDLITGGISSAESKDKIAGAQASISTSAQQSGFSLSSSNNLAGNTYRAAQQIADRTSEQASDVAKKLADAWLNGSDAAKEYGVVVNDQVLTGYMASQGVDIANVEITDAMKQYYRYQLMMEQLSSSNRDAMQDMIKEWTQLGFIIDKTKGKLFSFDEVIQLTAADPTIPEVGGSGLVYPDNESIGGIPPVIPPSGDAVHVPELSPMYVPVYYYEPEPYTPPVPAPVTVPVFVPGLELIPGLVTGLAYVHGLLPMPITLPVTVPGFEWIPQLQDVLQRIPGQVPVNIPVTVPGFVLAPTLLTYCMQLAANPFMSTVMFTVPGFELAPTLLGYLGEIAQTWMSKVDISVVGQAVLERALSLLQQVRSLLSSLGQTVVGGIQRAGQTIKTGVSTAYDNMKSTESSFGAGFSGNTSKTGTNSILSSWAPTSAADYGGGILGAVLADLDLNLTRWGLKSATKEGYTTQQLKDATAEYTGYNLNPFNQNSAADLVVKGAAASAVLAPVIGALSTAGAGGFVSSLGSFVPKFAFANGGIGTKEVNNATLFEGDKKEAVIPLETTEGIRYLSDALQQAGYGGGTGGDSYTINLTLSGVNIADNDAQWERVGRKIAEVIEVQRHRRGELNYGSTF